jgi:DNA-binding response OmpR family regulator
MSEARILLVEDDYVLYELIRHNLEARGHEVCIAAGAQAALVHLRTATFDLVLLDINLPDQTGWEVLRTTYREGKLTPLQVHGHVGQLPVVVLSAVRISSRRLQEFHPLAYLPKPFPMEAILRLAREAASRRRDGPVPMQEDEEEAGSSPITLLAEEDLYA